MDTDAEVVMSQDCVFCKIAAGQLPCTKVYEDADTIAFMDISPIVKGHVLVVPKKHYETLPDAPATTLAQLITVVQRVAKAQSVALKADGINVTQANGKPAGQVVPHLHFHVIPRFNNDGHSWTKPQGKYDDNAQRDQMALAIKAKIV